MHSIPFLQQKLEKEFSSLHFGHEPRQLYEPMDYMLTLAGKRLRPLFVLIGCELFGGDYSKAMDAAIGIELFHNFTLLHDDIMDNATKRRNQPAVHVKWNTNVAILSGDALFVKAAAQITIFPLKSSDYLSLFCSFPKAPFDSFPPQRLPHPRMRLLHIFHTRTPSMHTISPG